MIVTVALVVAVLLDTVTFLRMGIGRELNPAVIALGEGPAILARWLAVAAALTLAYLARPYWRMLRPLLLVAAAASAFGAMTNVWTLVA